MSITKAINNFFTFGIRPNYRKSGNPLNESLYSLIANNTAVFYNYSIEDYISKGYAKNAEVYSIIRKIVDKTMSAPHYLYIDKGEVKSKYKQFRQYKSSVEKHAMNNLYVKKDLEFAPETSDLYKLIKHPNEHQTWVEMMELFRIFYFVQGESFLYRETPEDSDIAISLNVAPANIMTPIFGGDYDDVITGWQITFPTGFERVMDAKDVFHLKMANPVFDQYGSQLRGMSPLVSGMKYLTQSDRGVEAWVNQLTNEGVKGIVSPNHADPKLWLSPAQTQEIKNKLDTDINSVNHRGKVTVSGMPLQYSNFGLSPTALALIEALKHSEVKLCNLWGVPAVLFEENPTYQNKMEGRKEFVSDVILPYLIKEEDALNRWLVKPFRERDGIEYVFDYDTSQYEELKPTKDFIDAISKYVSINEIRVMQGFDEKESKYADEIFVDQGKIPLSDYDFNFDGEA